MQARRQESLGQSKTTAAVTHKSTSAHRQRRKNETDQDSVVQWHMSRGTERRIYVFLMAFLWRISSLAYDLYDCWWQSARNTFKFCGHHIPQALFNAHSLWS